MYKILLVDDEALARNHVRSLIDWEKQGFSICGEAANGEIAIEMVKKHAPHVMITDVSMSGMNGVSLCKYIHDHHEKVNVIMLSSYDNYDYVRETLKLGAIDYLLKHKMNRDTLLELLLKLRKRLEEENQKTKEKLYIEENWDRINLSVAQNYLKEWVTGTEDHYHTIQGYFQNLSQVGTHNILISAMQVNNYFILTESFSEQEKNQFARSIVDLCQQSIPYSVIGIVSYVANGRFVFLFSFDSYKSENNIQQQLMQCTDRLKKMIETYMNIKVTFGNSCLSRQISEIPGHYASACKVLDGVLFGASDYIEAREMNDLFVLSLQQEKEILNGIAQIDVEQVNRVLEEVFSELKSRRADSDNVQWVISELIHLSRKIEKKSGLDGKAFKMEELKENLLNCMEELEDIQNWIQGIFQTLIEKLASEKYSSNQFSKYVQQAMKFVQLNYASPISLEETAEFIGITASYLSRLFREEIGISFTEHLNQVRINKAKHVILSSNIKIKDIYKKVGFSSYNYFFKVFKNVEGVTPSVFWKNNNG